MNQDLLFIIMCVGTTIVVSTLAHFLNKKNENKFMKWINSNIEKPKPLKDDGLTFVLISWLSEDGSGFRDYDVIYYSPYDEQWFRNICDKDIPEYDNWCYITDPQKQKQS